MRLPCGRNKKFAQVVFLYYLCTLNFCGAVQKRAAGYGVNELITNNNLIIKQLKKVWKSRMF